MVSSLHSCLAHWVGFPFNILPNFLFICLEKRSNGILNSELAARIIATLSVNSNSVISEIAFGSVPVRNACVSNDLKKGMTRTIVAAMTAHHANPADTAEIIRTSGLLPLIRNGIRNKLIVPFRKSQPT